MDAVKELRRRKGWNQRDLAKASGVGQDTISSLESGRHEPRPSTLRKIAGALGVEIEELFEEVANPGKGPRPLSAEWALTVPREKFQREVEAADTAQLHKLLSGLAGDEYTRTREDLKSGRESREQRHRRVEALSRASDVWSELRGRGEESPEKGLPVLRKYLEIMGDV